MMIGYFPFTFVTQRELNALYGLLGPVVVYALDETLVPDHMRKACEDGRLDLRIHIKLTPGELHTAVQAYKEWADLHQHHLTDLAGFLKANPGRFPMMDATNPSQISTQIRQYAHSTDAQDQDPMFQAALFLAMAQEYDQQHEEMRQEMGAVSTMERVLMEGLTGDIQAGADIDPKKQPSAVLEDSETGGYMTASRLEAWARMALSDDELPQIHVTGSPAVMDHLFDQFPEAVQMARLDFPMDDPHDTADFSQLRDMLRRLTRGDRDGLMDDQGPANAASPDVVGVSFYRLNGISPRQMCHRLASPVSSDETAGVQQDKGDTLIGLVTLPLEADRR